MTTTAPVNVRKALSATRQAIPSRHYQAIISALDLIDSATHAGLEATGQVHEVHVALSRAAATCRPAMPYVSVWSSDSHGPFAMVHEDEDSARNEINRLDCEHFSLDDGEAAGADMRDIAIYRESESGLDQIDGIENAQYREMAEKLHTEHISEGWIGATRTSHWR